MRTKEKDIYKLAFILSYYAVLLFLLEEYLRIHEINLVLAIVFNFQNIALFLSMLIMKNKTRDQ